jgi:hypothetical protein
MLRSGLVTLVVSSVSVTLQSVGFWDIHTLAFKLACSLGLSFALACFLGTYCATELAHNRTHK